MRQHVNPLSSNFNQIERIPSLREMFGDSKSNLHLDIGCAAGEFLFDLALVNTSWNYLGIEIREKLVKNAKSKVLEREIKNLYFVFGNANNILNDVQNKFIIKNLKRNFQSICRMLFQMEISTPQKNTPRQLIL